MKKLVSKLSLLLVLTLLICAVLPACKNGNEQTGDTTAPTVSTTPNGERVDENGYILDDLPDTLNMEGKSTKILGWQFSPYEFFDESSADTIDNALWLRKTNVESRLNTKLEVTLVPGSNDYLAQFRQTVETSLSDTNGYDIIMQYSGFGMMGATAGFYLDINDYEYVNFEKPWWPKNLQDCVILNDSVYFVSGDISVNCIEGMFAILVNNDMVENYQLSEDPYTLAAAGTWTLEKMISMSKDIHTDLDKNGEKSELDEFGFVFINEVSLDAFVEGSDLVMVDKNSDGSLTMNQTYLGEKGDKLMKTLSDFIHSNDGVFVNKTYGAVFPDGRAMFMVGKIDALIWNMEDPSFSFGVLPIPKYDLSQTDYKTTMNFNYSMFSIPTNADDPNMMSAVLEALGSQGYRTVTPAVFDTAFKLQKSESLVISNMFDLIRNGRNFDLGRLTAHTMLANGTNPCVMAFRTLSHGTARNWAAVTPTYAKLWNNALKTISQQLAEKT